MIVFRDGAERVTAVQKVTESLSQASDQLQGLEELMLVQREGKLQEQAMCSFLNWVVLHGV